MTSFDDAFGSLINVEKGYWDDPYGGPTMYGITEKVARANGYQGDMRALPLATAKTIAKAQYWDSFMCDQFDPRIGYQIFDTAYNGGHPAQWLQQAAGVTADGVIGAATVAAVRNTNPAVIILRFCAYRLKYLASLNRPDVVDGWVNRVADNMLKGAS